MNARQTLPVLLMLTASAAPLLAWAGEPVSACVSLGNDQEIVRAGNGDQFYLRDGQAHYRVAFRNSCDSITITPTVEISTNGQVGQLCPRDTKVKTKRDICRVQSIEQITAEEFTRKRNLARR
ncbi:hypothetical protein OVA13_04730 [Pseudoxanthomonas sp. SL93]|uniref:hypothetical protein n=1 Tax=Pseudoxanthomonas sp. SL93 TaxID=2995142 RepID=UPI00226FE551|nr:hypothetical protein [Pseudoxanthomonas sp. SL93]WAC64089.1 hypothetical protein OVA13_04730 [Pseudoxanthomonas sp. SL93]